jgi:hypothetical protein
MRRAIVLIPLLVACAQTETAQTDSAAMAAAAPAALTEAQVAGTWTGVATLTGTDSIIAHWTQVCANGTCRGTSQEAPNDTVTATYTLMADSMVGQSSAFTDPTFPGASLVDHWTVRATGDSVTGMGRFVLASNPDSVLVRYDIRGTRSP